MIIHFKKNEGTFEKAPFVDEEVRYHVMHRISEDDKSLLMRTEDSSIIAARTDIGYPLWLYVKENYEKTTLNQMLTEIQKLAKDCKKFEFVYNPELHSEMVSQLGNNYSCYMEMEAFDCKTVVHPGHQHGQISLSTLEDHAIIAEFCKGFIFWGFGAEVTLESQLDGAKRLIESGNLYTLKVNDKVVSMANIAHRSPRHARINYVYTPPSLRGNGYASELVADLSALILNEGLTPVLFTDLKNKTSNKIYQNVGYQPRGKMTHYVFSL